jgi:DNA replication protein DnaC
MLAHPTLDKLNDMGLTGMAKAFNELLTNGESEQLSHAEWLGLLLEREWSSRHDRKLAARLRSPSFVIRLCRRMSITAASAVSIGRCS